MKSRSIQKTNAIASHTYPVLNAVIRVITIDGTEWFPSKDVCDALEITNQRSAVMSACLPDEYQEVRKSSLVSNDVSFPNRGMLCVNESGLNALAFNSRKPEARAFRQWVTGTVLPAIRKDGMYVAGEEKVATGEMDDDTSDLPLVR